MTTQKPLDLEPIKVWNEQVKVSGAIDTARVVSALIAEVERLRELAIDLMDTLRRGRKHRCVPDVLDRARALLGKE